MPVYESATSIHLCTSSATECMKDQFPHQAALQAVQRSQQHHNIHQSSFCSTTSTLHVHGTAPFCAAPLHRFVSISTPCGIILNQPSASTIVCPFNGWCILHQHPFLFSSGMFGKPQTCRADCSGHWPYMLNACTVLFNNEQNVRHETIIMNNCLCDP